MKSHFIGDVKMPAGVKWIDFDTFVSRHGEHVAFTLLENLERHEGMSADHLHDLEGRWNAAMNYASHHHASAT
ncbi:MAG: hypothetical protein SFW62_07090 [Alphaproteobacteria bacterium]|nr:hypothetical protein [Alphaproteobacteria bacterium]